MAERAVFLDRDNTIIENDGYLGDPTKVKLLPGAATALSALRGLGYRLIVVSNQSGVARGMFDEAAVEAVNQEMSRQLKELAGAYVDASYYCPYHPEAPVQEYRIDHEWRKPKPGMLKQAAADFGLDLAQSWMVGDQSRDIGAGAAAGCRTILLRDPDRSPAQDTDMSVPVSPSFVVRTLADAARIILREGKTLPHVQQAAAPSASPAPRVAVAPAAHMPSPAKPGPVARAAASVASPVSPENSGAASQAETTCRRICRPRRPGGGMGGRLEQRLEELVAHFHRQQRQADMPEDFSYLNIGAMILQVLAVVALVLGIHAFVAAPISYKDWTDFFRAEFALHAAVIWLLVGVILQGMVIALMLRARKK